MAGLTAVVPDAAAAVGPAPAPSGTRVVTAMVGLKATLLRHEVRSGGWLWRGLAAAIGLAAAAFTIWTTVAVDRDVVVAVQAGLLLVWTVGWLAGPLVAGVDDRVRPEYFRLLAPARRPLAAGLFAAALVGVTPLVSLVAFGSLLVTAVRVGPTAVVVAVVVVPLQLAVVLLGSRVMTGWLMTSRRAREAGLLLFVVLCAAGGASNYLLMDVIPSLLAGSTPTLSTVLRALPTGWAATAVGAAADGNPLVAVAAVVGMLVLIAALFQAWTVVVGRRLTGAAWDGVGGRAPSASPPATAGTARAGGPGASPVGQLLPTTPLGASVSKELLLWRRDSLRWLALVAPVGESFWLYFLPVGRPFVAVSWLGWSALRLINAYGSKRSLGDSDDRGAGDGVWLWTVLTVPGAERVDVRALQIGFLLVATPFVLVQTVVAVLFGFPAWEWAYMLAVLPAALGGAAAFIALLSVYRPARFGAGGNGGYLAAAIVGCVPAVVVVAAPSVGVVLAGDLLGIEPLRWLGVMAGVAVGAVWAWWGGRLAHRRLTHRGPEILAALRYGHRQARRGVRSRQPDISSTRQPHVEPAQR